MNNRIKNLRLREVRESDCRLLWAWANDSAVREGAFSPDPIPWEEHSHWFMDKLHNPNCLIMIGLDEQELPVGEVRFDFKNEHEAEIDICVDKNLRGSGYGSILIHLALEKIFCCTSVRKIHAFVKADNQRSTKLFEKAGFKKLEMGVVKGNLALHYLLGKDHEQ